MNTLPQDPAMLLCLINTRLRDSSETLEEICTMLDTDRHTIEEKLNAAGFTYDESGRRFW